MFYGDLPPVGHKLILRANATVNKEWHSEAYESHYWIDSGTSALALALLDAKARRPEVDKPQAVIPGYCCPDLVAACVYAGVQPIAVDISAQDPAYDLEQLQAALGEKVVAVIAINFLGVAERLKELRELLTITNAAAYLIEDNAQWFPVMPGQISGIADYVTFSFGRGKPLSLLGGGLLLSKQPLKQLAMEQLNPAANEATFLPKLKAGLYNLLLNPRAYFFLNRNPLLSIGQTAYHELEQVSSLDSWRHELFASNYEAYQKRHGQQCQLQQLCAIYQQKSIALQKWNWAVSSRNSGTLLRYPLLCENEQIKSQLLDQLVAEGLGASPLYPLEITAIDGVDGRVIVPYGLSNAKSFARRFLTLPLHASVSEPYQQRLVSCLERI